MPGIGKSTWATNAPKAVVIPTEDGLREIKCTSFPVCNNLDEFRNYNAAIATNPHKFSTLVIDSADWLEKLIWREVAKEAGKDGIDEIGYGNGYKLATEKWSRMLHYIETEINIKRQMTVIFVAHSKVVKQNDPTTDAYDKYMPCLHDKADAMLREWCDDVLFVKSKIYTHKEDSGFNKKTVKASGGEQRIMYTTDKPSHVAKNRLSLPDEMPFAWDALAQYLPCLPKE